MSSDSEFSVLTTIYIIALCIVFGANPVAVKVSLAGLGPYTNAAVRFAFAVLVIIVWARLMGWPLMVKKKLWGKTAMVGFILSIQVSLFYWGMTKTTASHSALIANMMPFLVLILSHIFIPGDRITTRKVVGMVLGFAGVFVIFMENQQISPELKTGDLIILAAVFAWAARVVYTKKVIHNFAPFHLVIYPFIMAAPLFLLGGLVFDPVMVIKLDTTIVTAILYQSIAIASLGFVAWNTLLKKYGASSLYSFTFIMPLSGVCFGWLILDEPVTIHLLTSLVLVTAGLVVFHGNSRAQKQAPGEI